MTAEEPSPSVDLSRIASIEGKIRHICDLIPISTWGFTAEVNKKLRERKHRIVNQQLTTKEKQKLTKNKKQQVARSVGGICNKVSEVIDLLSTSHGRDTKVKKSVDPSTKPKIEDRKKQTEKKEKRKEVPSEPQTSATENLVNEKSTVPKEGLPSGDDSSDGESTEQHVESVPVVKSKKRPSTQPTVVESKKPKFDVKPVQCEAKDRALDIMEQREQAIRKLQEKLKAMRETRQGKKKAGGDPSKALAFEKERKLKRRMSKIKLKSRIAQQKLSKTDGSKQELRKAKMDEDLSKEDGSAVTFSKFDFLVKNNKKKRLSTSEKKQKFTGKDYKSLINKVEKREEKLEKLREKEPEKAAELEHDIKWKRALNKAQGIKMKDNMELLKKGMKRKEKMKEKRKENWSNRSLNVEKEKAKRQEKREENIGKRINDKKKKKLQTMRKKGRVL
uniref:SURF6 domain-containing protein n=1 Tax=Haemonchus contortus TaxID=6289 RepID=A0A7I4XXH4_HAECO